MHGVRLLSHEDRVRSFSPIRAWAASPLSAQLRPQKGGASQVARLDQADEFREAIAFMTGEAEADVQIVLPRVVKEADLTRARFPAALW